MWIQLFLRSNWHQTIICFIQKLKQKTIDTCILFAKKNVDVHITSRFYAYPFGWGFFFFFFFFFVKRWESFSKCFKFEKYVYHNLFTPLLGISSVCKPWIYYSLAAMTFGKFSLRYILAHWEWCDKSRQTSLSNPETQKWHSASTREARKEGEKKITRFKC